MIKIVCVGKIKEKYFVSAINEYLKRLSKYTKVSIVEIADEPSVEKALKIEGKKILSKIKDDEYVIGLDIEGKAISSLEFAKKIDSVFLNFSKLTFVIGGSYGLSKEVKDRSNFLVSFSKMTFPHQMFRVILLEQIYRSYKINNNESYHK
ncbi:MAG: 23S rRNA (pseudouridine(1915)-N(3))-methyltransferase RlmH [Bacilli bacterium]|nr:23S rRNA (pseudouridine(1915)-N(3))-methyltransferase RlmH [Bacilli bacterium]